eukprot:m.208173 g.208173  ORF g.208173 m.208173 type:complete len:226 (+) comp39701_c1_seq9:439-1116(+)
MSDADKIPEPIFGEVLSADQCPLELKDILPPEDCYSYVLEDFKSLSSCASDLKQPEFETTLRINLSDSKEADKWLKEFMVQSKTTYRVTRTCKPGMKRVAAKFITHCHHFQKQLSQKQLEAHEKALAKRGIKNPLIAGIRCKKTNCSSNLTLTILIPGKKLLSSTTESFLQSRKARLSLRFTHNHSLSSAHALSFRPVEEATKDRIMAHVRKGPFCFFCSSCIRK